MNPWRFLLWRLGVLALVFYFALLCMLAMRDYHRSRKPAEPEQHQSIEDGQP